MPKKKSAAPPPAAEDSGSGPFQCALESRVLVHGKLAGTVRFIGQTEFDEGTWVGVELDRPKGRNNGTIDEVTYFQCEDAHGCFVREKVLSAFDEQTFAANAIQTLSRGRKARKATRGLRNARAWNIMDNNFEDLNVKKGKLILDATARLAHNFGGDGPSGEKKRRRSQTLAKKTVHELDSIAIEKTYKGVHVTFPLKLETVLKLLEQFKAGIPLHFKYVVKVVEHFRQESSRFPTVERISVAPGLRLTVVGDLHGQLQDLYTIFTINGLPNDKNMYLFNGDFVDRGNYGVEIALTIFCFKLFYPDGVFINRGNHECRSQNSWMGFEEEVFGKYFSEKEETRARTLYNMFQSCFDNLPLASVVGEKVFVCHGGLFHADGITIKQLEAVRRKREPPLGGTSLEDKIFEDILWSDPRPSAVYPQRVFGRAKSARGAGVEFGPDVTKQFCTDNNIALVVRSHECVQEGFEIQHDGRLITVFSASRYCGTQTNKGAFITFDSYMQPEIQQYFAHSLDRNQFGKHETEVREGVLEQDLVRMIIERICDRKSDLYWYFTQHDEESTGTCTRPQWAEAMRNVLGLDLPFLSLQPLLCELEPDLERAGPARINYSTFLERYRMQMTGNGGWIESILQSICQKLYKMCSSVEEAFEIFDIDDDGKVGYDEFLQTFQNLDVGLTDKQGFELMRSIDTDRNGSIDMREFCERFRIVFDRVRITRDGGDIEGHPQEAHRSISEAYESKVPGSPMKPGRLVRRSSVHDDEWVKRKLHEIGELIFRKEHRLDLAFSKYDANGSGSIDREEFRSALRDLGVHLEEEDVLRIFATIDHADSNEISYLEFVSAFTIDDLGLHNRTHDRGNWQDAVIQMVANILFQHRVQLRSAFRMFDMENTGEISGDEFRAAVMVINPLLPQSISELQISSLRRALEHPETGQIHYKEFLEAFEIVDVGYVGRNGSQGFYK